MPRMDISFLITSSSEKEHNSLKLRTPVLKASVTDLIYVTFAFDVLILLISSSDNAMIVSGVIQLLQRVFSRSKIAAPVFTVSICSMIS